MGFSKVSKPVVPNFVDDKVETFFNDRLASSWKHGDLISGKIAPCSQSIRLGNNDYLGMASHPEVVREQKMALESHGNGQMMSATAMYRSEGKDPQSAFESKMADFLGCQDALLTQSGYKANVGLLQSIAGANDVIYIDMMAHMSVWEGAKASGAKIVAFRHNDVSHMTRKIKAYGPGVIVVDSVYSTDGDICPLEDVAKVSDEFGCCLVVDESHSLGIYGENGRGLVYELGIGDSVHFITASLSKAFCSRAGLITCTAKQKRFLIYTSKPAIFSSVVAPVDVVGLIKLIDLISEADDRRARLLENARKIRQGLKEIGFDIKDNDSPIIAIRCGTDSQSFFVRDLFNQNKVFGAVFAAPATPRNKALYRLSIHSELTDEDIACILNASRIVFEEASELAPAIKGSKKSANIFTKPLEEGQKVGFLGGKVFG